MQHISVADDKNNRKSTRLFLEQSYLVNAIKPKHDTICCPRKLIMFLQSKIGSGKYFSQLFSQFNTKLKVIVSGCLKRSDIYMYEY